jgi:hypothetical protein
VNPPNKTWSFTLRKENRLSAFENRTLRRTFGPKRDEIIVLNYWHIEGASCPAHSPNVIRMIKSKRMRCPGRVTRVGANGLAYVILVGTLEGKVH